MAANPHQVLIKFNADYADEFDVEGFIVMAEDEWKAHQLAASKHFEEEGETEVYFGTNEQIMYSDYEEYMSCFQVIELSQQGYDTLKELFNVHREGYSYEHAGKVHVVPTTDVIKHGTLAMIKKDE